MEFLTSTRIDVDELLSERPAYSNLIKKRRRRHLITYKKAVTLILYPPSFYSFFTSNRLVKGTHIFSDFLDFLLIVEEEAATEKRLAATFFFPI